MLKVLLVDDEPFILQGLTVLIDWEEKGFEIAETASNGLEALEYLRKNDVDLIIADIRMPGMSGLELLETVRREKITNAYFAIVSGYNDFEYAKTAICNACVDYILKPVGRDELLRMLDRVTAMHRECVRKQEEEQLQEKAYFSRQLISLIGGKYDAENLKYVEKQLELSGGIRYIAIEIDGRDGTARYMTEAEKRGQQKTLYGICLSLLEGNGHHCVFDVSGKEARYDVGFIYCDRLAEESGMEERQYLDNFLEKIRRRMKAPVVMLVGSRVERIEQIGESYRTAAVARSFQDFKLQGEYPSMPQAGNGDLLRKKTLDGLVAAVEQNDREQIAEYVGMLYEEINVVGMENDLVRLNVNYLLFQLVHLAAMQDENVNQEEILRFISSSAFEEKTIHGSRAHLISFAEEYADYLAQLRSKSAKGVLSKIEREVRENYAQNLTLKELSRKYFINSAYLGQIFRKQYGVSFKDYLNHYRIERAAELLLHSDMKMYEIAERVGYRDLDYFINRFIAAKGCSPARFRKQSRE